ncbi:MAG: M14 family zinc carboxypeptidase [Kangiellaceae bacterium]|jgi:hypothetical protein|nr:M14 family zinc carboxypeptidase [Kangiellaceae bacterium]
MKDNNSSMPSPRSEQHQNLLRQRLPELIELERLTHNFADSITLRTLQHIQYRDLDLPIYAIDIGQPSPSKPNLLICGGIHGIERIGAQVVISLLNVWLERLRWERSLGQCFEQISATIIPIVNPVGMFRNIRANGNGVDLMRNSPIDAEKAPFLVSGQRFSSWLPWYRGDQQNLELENQVLEQEVARLTDSSEMTISIDCHSGFGFRDRIWFPYAYRRRPMNDIAPIVALKLLWENSYPNHRYIFEPQSNHYMTHGDLWDYFYKKYGRNNHKFLPLTLEMGSWNWVRKRPLQLLKFEGLFNPLVPHRQQRTLRRHLPLMDFFRHAVQSYQNWLPDEHQSSSLSQMAYSLWYNED